MRLAILADIHGNPITLEAVLSDIQADGYLLLGDYAALGYDPVGVLERIAALPNARFVRGNTDRYTVSDDRPDPLETEVLADPALLPQLIEVARSFAWTRGYVTAHGWLEWLSDLPLEQRFTLPDGTRVLAVHAAPGTDDGPGMNPRMDDVEVQARFGGCGADLVLVGHIHTPQDRSLDGVRVVNVGSVSNPVKGDLRASYGLLEADEHGWQITLRRVNYDREAVLAALRRSRHPALDYLSTFFEGHFTPPWMEAI